MVLDRMVLDLPLMHDEVTAPQLLHIPEPSGRASPPVWGSADWLLGAQDLADACEEGDVEKFSQVLAEYDSMTKLDPWKTSILLKVKKRIPEEDFT